MKVVRELPNLEATCLLGRQLGQRLARGSVVALVGQLGAGKTHLTRAIAEGLGLADSRVVNSPTFVLMQEYQARLPVYHFDTYRLPDPSAFADLGAQEIFEGDGVSVVEWGDRVAGQLPADHLRVTLEVTGESSRRATLEAFGPEMEKVLAGLR